MGIRLEIAGDNSEQFSQALHGVFGLLKMYPPSDEKVAATVVADLRGGPNDTVGGVEVVAEVGPNPSVGEAPKRRGRPAKPPVTIELTAEPAKVEAGEPDPTSASAGTVGVAASGSSATNKPKPTIDEARTALKAVAALPNGQELTYGVLTEMNVKTLTEAYIKNAEQLMALCAAKMPAEAAA